jgi:nucleoside-diphosphate-sugar epimerase
MGYNLLIPKDGVSSMKILVTGAAGAVGSYVVKHLADKGHTVIACDLPKKQSAKLPGVHIVSSDLTRLSYNEIKNLVGDASGIIHTAAIVDIGKSKEEIWPLNVEVTRNLAIAATESNNCKLIHISSGSIYAPCKTLIKEGYELEITSPYEESKAYSEGTIQIVAGTRLNGLRWTVLRPALIYGPNCKFLGATVAAIPPIMKALGLRIGIRGGPITNWVHAEDVARAAIHCLFSEDTNEKIFNVADDSPTPFCDTVSDYMEAYGINLRIRIPVPPQQIIKLLRPIIDRDLTFKALNIPLKTAWTLMSNLHCLCSPLSVKVDREASPYIFHNTVFNNSALKETGFKYKWPNSKEAIPYVIKWYKDNRWIP